MKRTLPFSAATAAALLAAAPVPLLAEPVPAPLSPNVESAQDKWSPRWDYDGDGCYPSVAVGADGSKNGGHNTTGALNGNCHDASDMEQSNSYARAICNGPWCAFMYTLYFEKDQVAQPGAGPVDAGHRHDWEYAVVWTENDTKRFVSLSSHRTAIVHKADALRWDGDTHAKLVYHKQGGSTHLFRPANESDDAIENPTGRWHLPKLVSWERLEPGVRDALDSGWGKADFPLGKLFCERVAASKPSEVGDFPCR